MNTATYKNNGNNKYPVSTDTLDFIQEQIKLAYNLTDLYGKNYMLRAATATTDGLIVVAGELMPLRAGNAQEYIALREERVTVTAAGVDYPNARIVRYAEYTAADEGAGCFPAGTFAAAKTVEALNTELAEAKRHVMPRGAIIMWSGDISDIPQGFVLCDGTNGTPNLSGRFVLGYKPNKYPMGYADGEEFHTLSASESGLPSHSHTFNTSIIAAKMGVTGNNTGNTSTKFGDATITVAGATGGAGGSGASKGHNNMPPYYVLAYIMKTI